MTTRESAAGYNIYAASYMEAEERKKRTAKRMKLTLQDWRYSKAAFKHFAYIRWILCRGNFTPPSYRDKICIALQVKVYLRTLRKSKKRLEIKTRLKLTHTQIR